MEGIIRALESESGPQQIRCQVIPWVETVAEAQKIQPPHDPAYISGSQRVCHF